MGRWRPSKVRKYWHVVKVDVIETAQSSTGVEIEVQRGWKMSSVSLVREIAQTRNHSSWFPDTSLP